jgi:cyanophycin synthetase
VAESESFNYDDKATILKYCHQIGFPVVIKPLKGSKGTLAFVDLNSDVKVLFALKEFRGSSHKKVIVESFFKGIEYRLFTTCDKFVAALNRVPANVIGDGIHNINQFIKIKNLDPRRGSHGTRSLERIKVDEVVHLYLQKQKKTVNYIPLKGEQVFLRANSNISTGGDSVDVTDEVHPSVKRLAVKIIRAIPGCAYAGIDYLTTDIKAKPNKKNYIVIEVNDSPGLDIHHFPYAGKPRNVTAAIIDQLFPETVKAHRAYLLTHKVKIKKQKTFHQ